MILYLPGFSVANKEEQSAVSSALVSNGYEVLSHKWRHWSTEGIDFDVEEEMRLISQSIEGRMVDALIAKSIGSYVTARLIWSRLVDAPKIIFLGIPLNDLDQDEKEIMQLSMHRIENKLVLIQNSKDPHGSIEDLNLLVRDMKYNIILKEADNHLYNYPDDILTILRG
jgi:hypothetical protein